MTRFHWLVIASLLLASVGIWLTPPALFHAAAAKEPKEGADVADSEAAAWGALPRDAWRVGQRRVYDVDQQVSIASKRQDASGSLALDGTFELSLTPFEQDERGTSVRVEVRNGNVTRTQDGQATSMTEQLAAALAQPFAMVVGPRGEVQEIYMDPEMDPAASGMVRGMLSALQFLAPDDASQAEWTTGEIDSSGEFTARYRRSGARSVHKSKTRFKAAGNELLQAAGRKRAADVEYVLGASGVPERIVSKQVEVATMKQGELRSSGRVSLVLKSLAASEPVAVAVDRRHGGSLLDAPVATGLKPEQYAELAKGHSVRSLRQSIENGDRTDHHARADLMMKLEAVLRTEGTAAVAEAEQIVRELVNDEDARVVMGALESAQAPAAQASLLNLAKDGELAPDRRNTALMHLGVGEDPTSETLEGLRGMAEDADLAGELRDVATLALGGALRKADGEVQTSAASSYEYLVQRLSAAKTEQERAIALEALGNSGSSQVLATLQPSLKNGTPWERASAANALRHIQDAEADALLSTTATRDSDAIVRRQALNALVYRKLTDDTRSALIEALGTDADVMVRLTAVDVMGGSLEEEAGFAQALAQSSEHDQDERVRERALAVLNSDDLTQQ